MEPTYDIDACKAALIRLALDQKDLADEGLSESVISKFFRGEHVRPKTAKRIVMKLGLRWNDIVDAEPVGASTRRR